MALLLVVSALLALPARGRPLSIASEPDLPTWHDTVRLVVSGMGCAPTLSAPRLDGGEPLVAVDLHDVCNIVSPSIPRPFQLAVELPPLRTGTYAVRVYDVENGGAASAGTLPVYDVSRMALEVVGVPTDAEPPIVRFGGIYSCGGAELAVVGNIIELHFSSGCSILPPPPGVQFEDLSVDRVLPPGEYEVRLFDYGYAFYGSGEPPAALVRRRFRVWDADGCVPSPTRLCLRDGRFAVEVAWRDFAGRVGAGQAVPLPSNEGSGLFWFFGADNVELTVKLLDACGLNGQWWTFTSSSSTVQYEITVTDTKSQRQRRYRNELGNTPALIADAEAFPCL